MKKTLLCLPLLFLATLTFAQNGLENVIVEKYYISDSTDTIVNATGGVLPIGSVTYRIYADLLPGYRFQAAYGVNTLGGAHEMRIETTTLFFNNEDRGATSPTYTKAQSKNNTVMLDSWLSAGAACAGNFGIQKSDDDGVATVVNIDGVLQNANSAAGIPLTSEDGLIAVAGRSPEPLTPVGISTEIAVFDNQNDGTNGPVFSSWNGSWASLNGSIGPDTLDNKVLIAQITTDGVFSFELNIQIGTPTGGVQNYVAKNPVGNEILLPSLSYVSSNTTAVTTPKEKNSAFIIYPNPAHDLITLLLSNDGKSTNNNFTIYNLEGKVIMHKELGKVAEKYREQIDLSKLPNGLYYLAFSTDGIKQTKKLIKN